MMAWSSSASGTDRSVTVTAPSRAALLHELENRIAHRQGFSLATLNLDHVVKLKQDPAFREAYLGHTHVTADGNPIVWLSRLAGDEVELVPGSELVDPVAEMAARLGVPVALVGSTDASLRTAAMVLARRYPGISVVLALAPPMGFDPVGPAGDEAIRSIRDSGARICFLALGAPRQEVLAARATRALPDVGFLSVGAGIDFVSGAQRRAPAVVRTLAAEWLWRLGGSPRRMAGRYLSCAILLPSLTLRALACRREVEETTA